MFNTRFFVRICGLVCVLCMFDMFITPNAWAWMVLGTTSNSGFGEKNCAYDDDSFSRAGTTRVYFCGMGTIFLSDNVFCYKDSNHWERARTSSSDLKKHGEWLYSSSDILLCCPGIKGSGGRFVEINRNEELYSKIIQSQSGGDKVYIETKGREQDLGNHKKCSAITRTYACGNQENDPCEQNVYCEYGYKLRDDKCVKVCPSGSIKKGDECVAEEKGCDNSQVLYKSESYGAECVDKCPSDKPYVSSGECVNACPNDTTANSDKKCVSSNDNSLSGGTSGDSSSGESSSSGSSSSGNSVNNTCESNEIKTKDGECKNKSDMSEILAENMDGCFRCKTQESFKACAINKCGGPDATTLCTPILTKSCSL